MTLCPQCRSDFVFYEGTLLQPGDEGQVDSEVLHCANCGAYLRAQGSTLTPMTTDEALDLLHTYCRTQPWSGLYTGGSYVPSQSQHPVRSR